MENKKYKVYKVELINGSKGTIGIPIESEFRYILHNSEFIEDEFSETAIRSNAIVKYEFVRYE